MRICISLWRAGFHFNLGPIIRVWVTFCKVSHVWIHTNKYVIYVCSFHLWYLNLHLFEMSLEGDKRNYNVPLSNEWICCIATSSLIKIVWINFHPLLSHQGKWAVLGKSTAEDVNRHCSRCHLLWLRGGTCLQDCHQHSTLPQHQLLLGRIFIPSSEVFKFRVFHVWRAFAVAPSQGYRKH